MAPDPGAVAFLEGRTTILIGTIGNRHRVVCRPCVAGPGASPQQAKTARRITPTTGPQVRPVKRNSCAYRRIDATKRLPGLVVPTAVISTVILSSRDSGPNARPLGAPVAEVCPSRIVNLPHAVPLRLTVIRIDPPVGGS